MEGNSHSLAFTHWAGRCPCGNSLCRRPYLPSLVMCSRCKRIAHRDEWLLSESLVPGAWTCGTGGCHPHNMRGIPYADDDRYKIPGARRWKDWREYK